ncbi:MAG: DUF488 domain-containing protein [Deferribacteraceae bacterium]|jgi:uncharacterized protein (DUF488 family)|nr:DUF488 domain-containing protein [Deferribacteraceae bacterium]
MILYTIGFAKKSAKQFFELIRNNDIDILLDIRLNNRSQLAGFTKCDDIAYFLPNICQCSYKYCPEYAPTKDILDDFKNKKIAWGEYSEKYTSLMESRNNYHAFVDEYAKYSNVCLLCSEPAHENCHRRLLAEMIARKNSDIGIIHL